MGRVSWSAKWFWLASLLALALGMGMVRTLSVSAAAVAAEATTNVSAQVTVSYSGLRFNRTTQTYDTIATLTNTSSASLLAPIELHIATISSGGVTLQNATGTASDGHPFVAVPLNIGSLSPGASVTNVILRFRNPANLKFNFIHEVFAVQPNARPIANAGIDRAVSVGTLVSLDGSASSDNDGDSLSYDWSIDSKPAGSQATLNDSTSVTPTLRLDTPGDYRIKLVVSDGQLVSDPDTVTLSTLNVAPVANAGADQTGAVGSTLNLDGGASYDDDGDSLTYVWSLIARPTSSTASLSDPHSLTPSLTLDRPGNYTAQLIVNDGELDSLPDLVTLSTLNSRPVANAGADQVISLGQSLIFDGSESTDADGDPISFRWSLISQPLGSTVFLSELEQAQTGLTPDLAGDYVAQLIVNDGQLQSDPDSALVTVTPPPHEAVQITSPPPTSAAVGQPYQYDVEATDTLGRPLSYSLMVAPAGMNIDSASGLITWTPTNRDDANVSVNVSNGAGGLATQSFVIRVEAATTVGVPTVIGLSQVDAALTLSDVGLVLGNITQANSDSVPSGAVISQQPEAGTEVVVQSSVDLVISTGPEPVDLPPDPVTVAPKIDPTVATTTYASTEFLYTGESPIQTGVAPSTIEPKRAAVIRGRVLDKSNTPLPGVSISIKDHPEFGQTLSRADGWFDMAVNGGGVLTIDYAREGYLPAQRQVDAPWQDFAILDDVVLVVRDAKVTRIDLTDTTEMQVAQGSVVTDQDGTRQATLLIPAGTQASRFLEDGSTESLSTLTLSVTEYTVGENGPQSMPAPLPPTSGYTYAVDIGVEEATIRKDGQDVVFDRPVRYYVDNFLDFPVGGEVPVGYYDMVKGAWIPSDNGRIVKILGISGGLAQLDVTGNGTPSDAATLAALGVTDSERVRLASLYPVGKSLWRVQMTHLSTWDYNWPFGPPPGAQGPEDGPKNADQDNPDDCPAGDCCPGGQHTASGSIIGCENQTLGERIPLVGTEFSLNYRSDRAAGRISARTLQIPLTNESVPAGLKRIEAHVAVAGRTIDLGSFPAQANQKTHFTWDGFDAYGRRVIGRQPATVTIDYVYDGDYQQPVWRASSFGLSSGIVISGNRTREEISLSRSYEATVGISEYKQASVSGWSFDVHHIYDPIGKILHFGHGGRRSSQNAITSGVIETLAGNGEFEFSGDGGLATSASFSNLLGVAVGPDESIYITDENRIRRIDPNGTVSTIAGNGQAGYSGDGGFATNASLNHPSGIAFGSDGNLYIADTANHRIRRIRKDGIIETVAGNGESQTNNGYMDPETAGSYSGDGGAATNAGLSSPTAVAVAPDGTLYISDTGNNLIRRVGPDGVIHNFAGVALDREAPEFYDEHSDIGDNAPAVDARLNKPYGIAIGADGSLYIADAGNHRIRRVGLDGIITTVAGNGDAYYSDYEESAMGDGGSAKLASVFWPTGIAIAKDDSIYIVSDHRVRMVSPDGIITTVAGKGCYFYDGVYCEFADSTAATKATFFFPFGVAMGSNGLYVADTSNARIRHLRDIFPGTASGDLLIPSEDGSEIYHFDSSGRHLRTLDAMTSAVRFSFFYDEEGQLIEITDLAGLKTRIERNALGSPEAIVAPFGQRTLLNVNGDGYLASVVNSAGERHQLAYTPDGLLTAFIDPNNHASQFTYDALGRLKRDSNAAGGHQNLVRNELDDGFTITRTTALNRATAYTEQNLAVGDRQRTVRAPDGTETHTVLGTSGSVTITEPDGSMTKSQQDPDPRFGMLSPVTSSSRVTTGGLTATLSASRTATLASAGDPLSLIRLIDNATLNGQKTISVYDVATRTLTATSPASRKSTVLLDALGRVTQAQVTGILPVNASYDNQGRLSAVTQGTGAEARTLDYVYGTDGYLASVTDPLDRQVRLEYDLAGRVTTQTLPDGRQILYGYDAKGNLISLTPPGQPAHRFRYSAVDKTEAYVPPDVGAGTNETLYTYDLDKNLISVARPDGQTVAIGYDAAGRAASLTLQPGNQILASYGYDGTSGKLKTIDAPDAELSYSYNGALLTQTQWTGEVNGRVGFGYDNSFRVNSVSLNGANPVAYVYDADSLLTKAGSLSLTRNAQNGLLTGTTLGQATESYGYSSFGELAAYEAKYGATSLLKHAFTRDKLGRIVQKQETRGGVTRTYDYAYDTSGRLVEVKLDGVVQSAYTYDDNGNRLSRTTPNGTETGIYDEQDRLLSYGESSYTYTANGELATKTEGSQTTQYGYDVLGNLKQVILPDGTVIDYLTDGRNRRIGKKANGVLTQGFLWQEQLQPIAELDGAGNVVSRFVYATGVNVPDYMIKGGVTYRIIKDHLGSPRLVMDVATNTVAQEMAYDEFGNVLTDTNPGFQPFGFAGGLYDRETGLVRFGARDFDAFTARWTSSDPIRFQGDSANLYNYVGNSPVDWQDFSGLFRSWWNPADWDASTWDAAKLGFATGVLASADGFMNSVANELGFGFTPFQDNGYYSPCDYGGAAGAAQNIGGASGQIAMSLEDLAGGAKVAKGVSSALRNFRYDPRANRFRDRSTGRWVAGKNIPPLARPILRVLK